MVHDRPDALNGYLEIGFHAPMPPEVSDAEYDALSCIVLWPPMQYAVEL